jgi:DNA repair exonuclease SbcCD ATPase subunit
VVELQRVEAELRLSTEGERLVTELQRERDRQRTVPSTSNAMTKRLQTEMEENSRLRKLLDEARAKLDAIATIERNISSRPPAAPAPANEGRNP